MAGLFLPLQFNDGGQADENWPALTFDQLPAEIQSILKRTPQAYLDFQGFLQIKSPGKNPAPAPLAPTQWNLEHNQSYHRLRPDKPWGIVLHWYGDKENFDHSLKGYLRGFDSLREIDDYITQTSAHFLIGDDAPGMNADLEISQTPIAVIQTQAPDQDGTPFIASHLRNLDYEAHWDKRQYFVRAYYQLANQEPAVHSLLQDMFDGPREDPNRRTIAIEITGFSFDQPDYYPGHQKIANVLATVWAIMRRYRIPVKNLLGHHEIQLGKADPGKKLMAMIRFLLGVKALLEGDQLMCTLIFGQYLSEQIGRQQAVDRYFRLVYDYATLVGSRRSIYEWEIWSKYWLVMNAIDQRKNVHLAKELQPPLSGSAFLDGKAYLAPKNHEGVDLYVRRKSAASAASLSYPVKLIGDGLCLYHAPFCHCGQGSASIFRHYQADGSEILTVYEQLNESAELVQGQSYPKGYRLGNIKANKSYQTPYLHFAIAYGSCWEMDLQNLGHPPLNAGQSWITERYLEPLEFLANLSS